MNLNTRMWRVPGRLVVQLAVLLALVLQCRLKSGRALVCRRTHLRQLLCGLVTLALRLREPHAQLHHLGRSPHRGGNLLA